jgi:hypothetical protein
MGIFGMTIVRPAREESRIMREDRLHSLRDFTNGTISLSHGGEAVAQPRAPQSTAWDEVLYAVRQSLLRGERFTRASHWLRSSTSSEP